MADQLAKAGVHNNLNRTQDAISLADEELIDRLRSAWRAKAAVNLSDGAVRLGDGWPAVPDQRRPPASRARQPCPSRRSQAPFLGGKL